VLSNATPNGLSIAFRGYLRTSITIYLSISHCDVESKEKNEEEPFFEVTICVFGEVCVLRYPRGTTEISSTEGECGSTA
jgi:hypothetical protein